MVKISIRYEGELRCAAQHGPSGTVIHTDAPTDNHGRGESFSPTDLVATALGSCMATIMGIAADRHGIDLRGMEIEVAKTMSEDAPRRIARLAATLRIPLPPDHPKRGLLENAAVVCPVYQSLSAEMEKTVDFHWMG